MSEFCCLPFCLSKLIADVHYSSSGSTKSVEGKLPLDREIAMENIPVDGPLETTSAVEAPIESPAETGQIIDSESLLATVLPEAKSVVGTLSCFQWSSLNGSLGPLQTIFSFSSWISPLMYFFESSRSSLSKETLFLHQLSNKVFCSFSTTVNFSLDFLVTISWRGSIFGNPSHASSRFFGSIFRKSTTSNGFYFGISVSTIGNRCFTTTTPF
jgi:hypothetical protein